MIAWTLRFGLITGMVSFYCWTQAPQPDGAGLEPGRLPERWLTGGPRCMEVPDWQVHEYNEDFYILRESGCTHYEKPFLYLIFGNDRVILMDTGAGKNEVGLIVRQTIAKWLDRKKRASIPLTVIHSHGHSDHIAGDAQFQNDPSIEFVPATVEAISKRTGIRDWPIEVGSLDLGNRVLDVIPNPGHHVSGVVLYDRRTGLLLSGDNVYPGRLYINDWPAFERSVQRLVDFSRSRIVAHVLGCHIEQMDQPYREYPIGSIYQPREHVLELSKGHILELNEALKAAGGKVQRIALRDMTVWPLDQDVLKEMQRIRKETEERQRTSQWSQQ